MQKQKNLLEVLAPSLIVISIALVILVNIRHVFGYSPTSTFLIFIAIAGIIAGTIFILYAINLRFEQRATSSEKYRMLLVTSRLVAGATLLSLPLVIASGFDFNHWIGTWYAEHGYQSSLYEAQGFAVSAHQLTFIIPGICLLLGVILILTGANNLVSRNTLIKICLLLVILPLVIYAIFMLNFAVNY